MKRIAVLAWAISAAVAVNLFVPLRWWHPYCHDQADGPGYAAIGLPLPYAEPTGASSMEYFFMPHVYLLDVLLLAGLAHLLTAKRAATLRLSREQVSRMITVGGSVTFLVVIGLQAMTFTTDWWPVMSIADKPDRYLDYRPMFLVDPAADHACSE